MPTTFFLKPTANRLQHTTKHPIPVKADLAKPGTGKAGTETTSFVEFASISDNSSVEYRELQRQVPLSPLPLSLSLMGSTLGDWPSFDPHNFSQLRPSDPSNPSVCFAFSLILLICFGFL